MSASSPVQVRVLTLNENDHLSNVLYRLKRGWIVQIVLSSHIVSQKVKVFTNSPKGYSNPFQRNSFRELKWVYPSTIKYDDSNRYCSIECVKPGTFQYYFTTNGTSDEASSAGSGYFQVEPVLVYKDSDNVLAQDSILCQSVLSKSLGLFEEWESRLEVTKQTGYNMIHFTPIQKLYTVSNSSYAITDHHKLNPIFGDKSYDDLAKLVDKLAREWHIFSITDLVYNHAANDCELLKLHPEAAYNLQNSPHLKPACVLDSILMQFTRDCQAGLLEGRGIPANVKDYHLQIIRHYLLECDLPRYRLWEYYQCHVDELCEEFRQQLMKEHEQISDVQQCEVEENKLQLKLGTYKRLQAKVDLQMARQIYFYKHHSESSLNDVVDQACSSLRHRLVYLNQLQFDKVQKDLVRAVDNALAGCRYHFFSPDGPKYEQISVKTPFVGNYFAYPNGEFRHPNEIERLIDTDETFQQYTMAHNGWIVNDNPLRNFAEEGEDVYFRRELVQWSDIVKLRFGTCYEDSPALWDYMKEYTRLVATTFHGCRLDNCHSTPLVVAQTLMDYAREINPNFYILAELFTGNEDTDKVFVNKLGINSLVRESMNAWDTYELGRLVGRYGGDPIGSFFQPPVRPILSQLTHSFFYDQTHDNPCPIERRSLEDVLPRSACVAMACCSNGSNKGYDELVPHYIDVVHEKRVYSQWVEEETNMLMGLIPAKLVLNRLHCELVHNEYQQITIDQLSSTTLCLTRHNPGTHQSIILVAHTAFSPPQQYWEYIRPLNISGHIDEILFEMTISSPDGINNFKRNPNYINGLNNVQVNVREHLQIEQSQCVNLHSSNAKTDSNDRHITFDKYFPPGTVIAFKVSLLDNAQKSVHEVRKSLREFIPSNDSTDSIFQSLVKSLSLVELNRLLYRCSQEELADGKGFDVYEISGHGKTVYCGLQGIMSVLEKIRLTNDLRHPLCNNLKDGNWLLDYITNRLLAQKSTQEIGEWYRSCFSHLTQLPRYLIPAYFDAIVTGSYTVLVEHGWNLMTKFIREGSLFVKALAQSSVQLCGIVQSARLPLLSPLLSEPRPQDDIDEHTYLKYPKCPTLSAGLPHFAAGLWRNWGRETFISLRGLMLLTDRFEEARYILIAYAQCLRHGLIPNLLGDGARQVRYNSRDAVWWWLYSIGEYIMQAPDGHEILDDRVSRIYPTHDSPPQPAGAHDHALYDVIQECLLRHLQSVTFRERGAGYGLDQHMSDEGFNNRIGVDFETGFVYGGNRYNCGTWMDKMGSSEKAGNKGIPGSPRDGSAVELIGLCRATLKWLIKMSDEKHYPYDYVETSSPSGSKIKLKFEDWLAKIDSNFEKYYWIDELDSSSPLINRRQIYKDTINSSLQWSDYQFRPNFLVASVVAPEMFDKYHIWKALEQVEKILLGKYGIKTLDPNDYNYVGDYVNDDDSTDPCRAHGFNYHNGPEWLWLMGYYLRSKLYWASQLEKEDETMKGVLNRTIIHCRHILTNHQQLIMNNDWKGLPELTNAGGVHCPHSCTAQASTSATLLETMYDLARIY